jgi:short chain dehydrogenase
MYEGITLTDESDSFRRMRLCQVAVADAVQAFGRVDILLCCTSEAVVGTVEELAASRETQVLVREQFATNFFGPINIIKATIPTMRQQKIGHIIVLGGITGNLGMPGMGMHCAANWALEGYCDSITYEIAPFNIKMTILQANVEVGILLNQIRWAPAHPAYSPEATNAPIFRVILAGLLNRLPGIKAQYVPPKHEQVLASSGQERSPGSNILSSNEGGRLFPPLSKAHTERLLAETVHALTAIGGHENPPSRHIVGAEGVAIVKEKLKTMSEELEDFVEASYAVDISGAWAGPRKPNAANGEKDAPANVGSADGDG